MDRTTPRALLAMGAALLLLLLLLLFSLLLVAAGGAPKRPHPACAGFRACADECRTPARPAGLAVQALALPAAVAGGASSR